MCLQDGDRAVGGAPEENIVLPLVVLTQAGARGLHWRRAGDHAWDSTL